MVIRDNSVKNKLLSYSMFHLFAIMFIPDNDSGNSLNGFSYYDTGIFIPMIDLIMLTQLFIVSQGKSQSQYLAKIIAL